MVMEKPGTGKKKSMYSLRKVFPFHEGLPRIFCQLSSSRGEDSEAWSKQGDSFLYVAYFFLFPPPSFSCSGIWLSLQNIPLPWEKQAVQTMTGQERKKPKNPCKMVDEWNTLLVAEQSILIAMIDTPFLGFFPSKGSRDSLV